MRFNKQVELKGEAPICPIELSDLVVGMNHLGWAPLSQDRFVLRKSSPFSWLQSLLHRIPIGREREGNGSSRVPYRLEAAIEESAGRRNLVLKGSVPLSERGKLDSLMDALHQGRRWLTREGPLG